MAAPVNPVCLHVLREGLTFSQSLYVKRSFKKKDANGNIQRAAITAQECPICFTYGLRSAILLQRKTPGSPQAPPPQFINLSEFAAGERAADDVKYPFPSLRTPLAKLDKICFRIIKGENGEQYHAIVCSILGAYNPDCILLCTSPKTPSEAPTAAQLDLLWYYIPSTDIATKPVAMISSKAAATECIADVFKQQLLKPDMQAKLYQAVRYYLDDESFNEKLRGRAYLPPSYTAKYWINRYLMLTGQGKLPKPGPQTKIAIIMLRTQPEADDPRLMTDAHLIACINAIRAANSVAAAHEPAETPVTHALLFGDKDRGQMQTVIEQIRSKWPAAEKERGLRLLYLTSPFKPDPDATVTDFWANFRGLPNTVFSQVPEAVPVEVKTLGFFLALQKRYQNSVCAIGFRSGTLDGAGFIGIPIFYLDDTATKNDWGKFADLAYLWDGASAGATIPERMAKASQSMNTFVRINVMAEYEQVQIGGVSTRVVQVKKEESIHLGAALYTFMFKGGGAMELLWQGRVTLMNGSNEARRSLGDRCRNFVANVRL